MANCRAVKDGWKCELALKHKGWHQSGGMKWRNLRVTKPRAPIGADLTRRDMQEIAQEMIRTESYRWCRARFFHALVGAWKQGKMQEVLDELLDEKAWDKILDGARDSQEISDNLINELGNRLVETGWLK